MKPTPNDPQQHSDLPSTGLSPEMRKRLAIAGGLVAVALAAIPVLESLSGGEKTAPPSSSTPLSSGRIVSKEEAASAPALVIAQLPESSAPLAASTPAVAAPQADGSHPPVTGSPAAPLPGSPQAATPAPQNHPPLAAAGTPAKPAAAPPLPAAKPTPAQTHSTDKHTAPLAESIGTTPAGKGAVTQATAAKLTPLPAPARMPTLAPGNNHQPSLGYQLQLGLFSSPGNAEKLVSDLKKHGLSARTETRVQLGPFRTRAEAEEAMQRLRELGYQPLLVPLGTQ
ncbi:SPOR domain-containing protein [Vogesella sp. GCM10023246]|uniref:SPOR domain-containing protein n=1 Tax=Vogesella oryzagri TaxID=3160864 RepID=A0ABV1LZ92_9NEIS